jgi:hypothetical protein
LGAFGWSYAQINSERLLPGITIAGTPVGRQLPKTAEKLVETQLNQQFKEGIQVQLDNHQVSLGKPKGLITYDVSHAVKEANLLGHTGPLVHRLLAPLKGQLFGYEIAIHAEINETELAKRVTSSLGDKLAPPKDAELIVQPSATSSEIALFITPEKTGVTINIQTLKEKLETQTNTGSNQPILLTAETHTAHFLDLGTVSASVRERHRTDINRTQRIAARQKYTEHPPAHGNSDAFGRRVRTTHDSPLGCFIDIGKIDTRRRARSTP